MPKLKINGTELEVPAGTSILQAAETLGIEVPRFCYHDKLSVPANCRMCLVEVKPGPPKPAASCGMACADNMEVFTDSDMVKKARKGVMEFLLINHPLDCPICDQGGECDLQDQALGYGFDRSRYHENKRAVPDKDLGPLVRTSMNRCIQCTRCIRFGEEIAGVAELGLLNRGEDVEISTFIQKAVSSELSGNLVDVCPVGALTSKPYTFKARPWELTKTETIDVHDAVGCNIRVDARSGEVLRVLPRLHEDVNEEWINDRTRHAGDGLTRQRLDRPYVRDAVTRKLRPSTWEEAFGVIAARLTAAPAQKVAALAGDLCDLESMVALKDLMAAGGITNLECRTDGADFDASSRAGYLFNTTIAGIEQADAILLVGADPRWEATLVNARIRKTWLARRIKIAMIGEMRNQGYPVRHIGTGASDLQALLDGNSDFAAVLEKAERPMIILGMGALKGGQGAAVQALARAVAEKFGMVKDGWNGFNLLHTAAARVGALDIGFTSKQAIDYSGLDVLWLHGVDDFDMSRIAANAFVVYQGHHGDAGAQRADVILPGAAYTEKDAIYVNLEGRVQRAKKAVSSPGDAREDWTILRALSGVLGHQLPYDDLAALRARIATEWPHLAAFDRPAKAEWAGFGTAGTVQAGSFAPVYDNFYMTNVIARASVTMAQCLATFSGQHLAEAAE
jgi:NADH-quinone oxidoreductase subunit G